MIYFVFVNQLLYHKFFIFDSTTMMLHCILENIYRHTESAKKIYLTDNTGISPPISKGHNFPGDRCFIFVHYGEM